MAANRVGALYYEAILDPRGFSRGVLKVRNDQAVLAKAIQDTTSPLDRLQAELNVLDRIYDEIAAKDPFEGQSETLDALVKKTMMLSDEIDGIGRKEQEEKEEEEAKKAEQAAKEEEDRRKDMHRRWLAIADSKRKRLEQDDKRKKQAAQQEIDREQEKADRWTALAKARQERLDKEKKDKEDADKAEKARLKELEKEEKRAAKQAEDHEKRMSRLQMQRSAKRLANAGQYMKSFDGLKILFADLRKSVTGLTGGLSRMAGNLAQAAGMGPQVQGLARVFGGLGLKVLGVVAAVYALSKALASAAMAADQYAQRQIKIKAAMGGNEVRAKALTEQMRLYAAETSYTTSQMQEFAARLLTLGVSARKIPDIAEKLGGLAMGDPERLRLVGKAYADVMTKGRLMAQEANQFANANIPIYQSLSEITGKSVATVQKMTEQGQISAEMVDEALQRIRETTGADAAMEERSETIAGQWDEIKSSASEIWRILGGPIQKTIVSFLKVVNGIIKGFEFLAKKLEPIIEDVNLFYGMLYNAFVLMKSMGLRMSGVSAEMERQAKLEGDLADLKKEQEAAARAQLEIEEKQTANFEEMQQELTDELQGYYDRFNEEERLADIQFERMLQEKLMMGDITEEQLEQLRNQREFVLGEKDRLDAEKKRADEAKKLAEEEKKQQQEIDKEYRKEIDRINKEEQRRDEQLHKEAKEREANIEKEIKDKMGLAKDADSGAGVSFEAGSVEEFNLMRQMEMQARRDAQQLFFEQEAQKARQESNRILSQMLLNMRSDAQQERDDAQWNYYGN